MLELVAVERHKDIRCAGQQVLTARIEHRRIDCSEPRRKNRHQNQKEQHAAAETDGTVGEDFAQSVLKHSQSPHSRIRGSKSV